MRLRAKKFYIGSPINEKQRDYKKHQQQKRNA
jgi:hypothetical protein